ncbi:hypothetical protein [Beijerinckia mobilis]|uniref:hypothetical protein n=1 Tax=Beijerinckia mobilis TaxID=231434 RepID=UPI000556C034|nr:hypothetical protein [Beijerinckia mobilis]
MISIKITTVVVSVGMFILSACNDPTVATKENLHKTLAEFLDTRCFLVGPQVSAYPVHLSDTDEFAPYDALVKVNLLKRGEDGLYDLTDKGRSLVRLPNGENDKLMGFCAYHIDVGEIQTITEARTEGNYSIHDVTFNYKRRDEPWASDSAIQAAFKRQFIPVEEEVWTLPMMLTNGEWGFMDHLSEKKGNTTTH